MKPIQITFFLDLEINEALGEYIERKDTAVEAVYEALDRIQKQHPELKDFRANWSK